LSIKSILSVAVILGLTCTQVQAGPKRYPWGDRTSGRDLDVYRYDTREADRLRAEWQADDNGDPNKGWAYNVLFMRSSRGAYGYVYPTRYGPFASKEECEQARDERIARMETDPKDPNAPVKFPVQAWYSETPKQYEHSETQIAGSGGVASTQTGVGSVTPNLTISLSGGAQTNTQKEQVRGGAQHAMLFKHCVPHTYRQMKPIPNMKGPSRPGGPGTGRRAENQQ
jgi:hypothetical protein